MNETIPLNGIDSIASENVLNPFVYHVKINSVYDKFKIAIFTIVIFPVRVVVFTSLLLISWTLATIGMIGVSQDELLEIPFSGWRRCLRSVLFTIVRVMFGVLGFHWVRTIGKQATRQQAPVLAVAPHTSFYDGILAVITGNPTMIAEKNNSFIPIVGRVLNFSQPVYVRRDDRDSRRYAILEIIRRIELDWPQILIFPEGTCTNGSCLITFKPGAFYPTVPVQPVLVRYPNKLNTITWTWDSTGALRLFWLTMTQLYTKVVVEFLPVYVPSEYERYNPLIFAESVRNVMAKALAVPLTDYTYDDAKVAVKANRLGLPMISNLITVERLRSRLGLTHFHAKKLTKLSMDLVLFQNQDHKPVNLKEFAKSLSVTIENSSLVSLFKIHLEDPDSSTIDLKKYLLAEYILEKAINKDEIIILAFKLYGNHFDKNMFEYLLTLVYNLPKSNASLIYHEMTDTKDEIQLADYLEYCEKHPENITALQNYIKTCLFRTATNPSSSDQQTYA